jgi:hypothetical protein
MPDPQRVMADAEALLHRVSPEGRRLAQRARARRFRARMAMLRRMLAALAVVVAAAIAWGLAIGPIGQFGFLAAVVALVVAWVVIVGASRVPEITTEALGQSDLPALPQRTEAWLQRQRPALPAPAQRLADGIGVKLEAIAPQVQALDPAEPAAAELRKLLAQELPDLVEGYTRVPQALRGTARDGGPAPDQQLVAALSVVDTQLDELSAALAEGDLRRLATQGRYLELKYKDDGAA